VSRRAAPSRRRQARERTLGRVLRRGAAVTTWLLVTLAGVAALCGEIMGLEVPHLADLGALTVATAYTWALTVRTGGRPIVYAALAVALGAVVLVVDNDLLRNGASVLTAVVTGVFAVMATVPAVQFSKAVREAVYAALISAGGALAVVGFSPEVALNRFDYTTLACSLVVALGLVYRLGAGLHGLGRRGIAVVAVGGALLAVTMAYAEALRHYGSPALVGGIDDVVAWTHDHLGAVPRPRQFLIGFPALIWGCHMRARRRQGWWVCAFGVAGTTSVAAGLMHPHESLFEAVLTVVYSLVLGLVIGYAVIRVDLAFTAPKGARGRRAEEATALRPEPSRMAPLL